MKHYDIETKVQDLRFLQWDENTASSGTAGCLLKSKYMGTGNISYYYKLANYDSYNGIFGYECINEIIASRLLYILGIEHLQYQLVHALVNINGKEYTSWICKSKNFRKPDEKKISMDVFYDLNKKDGESPFDVCKRFGFEKQITNMFLLDFLIVNRDRHGANLEVLANNNQMKLAPIFDNGLSLLSPYALRKDQIKKFDNLCDIPVNNFIGSKSLFDNLKLIKKIDIDMLNESDKDELIGGLEEAVEEEYLEKSWDIIWNRWRYYNDNFCNKR